MKSPSLPNAFKETKEEIRHSYRPESQAHFDLLELERESLRSELSRCEDTKRVLSRAYHICFALAALLLLSTLYYADRSSTLIQLDSFDPKTLWVTEHHFFGRNHQYRLELRWDAERQRQWWMRYNETTKAYQPISFRFDL